VGLADLITSLWEDKAGEGGEREIKLLAGDVNRAEKNQQEGFELVEEKTKRALR